MLGLLAVSASLVLSLPAAPSSTDAGYRSCDGEAQIVAVKRTTCMTGGRVYRAYMRRCAVGRPSARWNCTVQRYRCRYKRSKRVTTCSRGRARVVFVVI